MVQHRRSQTLRFVGASSIVAVVGCSLVIDTSGLVGPADGSGAIDAAAASDADAGDSGTSGSVDASTEASRGPDGAAPCDATFCDDFDDGPLGATWTRTLLNKGALDFSSTFVSAPHALRASFFGASSPDDRYAMLERDLGMGTHLRCDFSMYVSRRADKDSVNAFVIRTTAPGIPSYFLALVLPFNGAAGMADDITYSDGGCACPQKAQFALSFDDGAWKRMTVQTDFSNVTMAVDGVVVVSDTFGPIVPTSSILVGLGGRAYSSITSETLFDDFSCTLTP